MGFLPLAASSFSFRVSISVTVTVAPGYQYVAVSSAQGLGDVQLAGVRLASRLPQEGVVLQLQHLTGHRQHTQDVRIRSCGSANSSWRAARPPGYLDCPPFWPSWSHEALRLGGGYALMPSETNRSNLRFWQTQKEMVAVGVAYC